jgi:predicted RNA binding protein YcfA (HicA-like mRNA interferase family)
MPKLPRISSRETIRALEKLGFEKVRQTGSHVILQMKTEAGTIGCVVPYHSELKNRQLKRQLKRAADRSTALLDVAFQAKTGRA